MPDEGTPSLEETAAETNRRLGELEGAIAILDRKLDALAEELRGLAETRAGRARGVAFTDLVETVKERVERTDVEPFVRRVARTWFARPNP